MATISKKGNCYLVIMCEEDGVCLSLEKFPEVGDKVIITDENLEGDINCGLSGTYSIEDITDEFEEGKVYAAIPVL